MFCQNKQHQISQGETPPKFQRNRLAHTQQVSMTLAPGKGIFSSKEYQHWCSRDFAFIYLFIFSFIFISWRLITLQYCSGFCHTLTWISHGFTCVPHPEPPSHILPHPIPLDHPSAPAPSTLPLTCTMLRRSVVSDSLRPHGL